MAGIERLLVTVWVGALLGVGYLAVPVLFASLDDRQLAGELAGQMFRLVGYVGLGTGALLLATYFHLWRDWGKKTWHQWRIWLVSVMIFLVSIGLFVLQPMMIELKQHGLPPGSEQAAQFGRLHGASSIIYLLTTVLGFVLVFAGGRTSGAKGC